MKLFPSMHETELKNDMIMDMISIHVRANDNLIIPEKLLRVLPPDLMRLLRRHFIIRENDWIT